MASEPAVAASPSDTEVHDAGKAVEHQAEVGTGNSEAAYHTQAQQSVPPTGETDGEGPEAGLRRSRRQQDGDEAGEEDSPQGSVAENPGSRNSAENEGARENEPAARANLNEEPDGEDCPLLKKESKLHIDPPERVRLRNETRYLARLLCFSWTSKDEALCARSNFQTHANRGLYTDLDGWVTRRTRTATNEQKTSFLASLFFKIEGQVECSVNTQRRYVHNHLVVGIVNPWTGVARERLVVDIPDKALFRSIRREARRLRPLWKRFLSLKSIQGFAMYECFPEHEYHQTLDLDHQTELVLRQLFQDYARNNILSEYHWLPWIQQHFNHGDREHGGHRYALQFVLRWSAWKITLYGLTPILLSLAIGFWFQYSIQGERVAVIQTAWTISGFIIGGASLLIAIAAAVTQIGGV